MNRYVSWHQEVEGLSNWKWKKGHSCCSCWSGWFLRSSFKSNTHTDLTHVEVPRTDQVLSYMGLLCVSIAQVGLDDWNQPKKGRWRVQLKSRTSIVLKRDTAGKYLAFAFLVFFAKVSACRCFLLGERKAMLTLAKGCLFWTALPTCLTPWLWWQMQHRYCSSGLAPACNSRWSAESSCEGRCGPPTNVYGSIGFPGSRGPGM